MRFAPVFAAALLIAATGATAVAVHAQDKPAPAEALSVRAILERVEAQGYRDITEVEREHGRYEVKAVDAEGRRVKVYLDARTGEIVKTERK